MESPWVGIGRLGVTSPAAGGRRGRGPFGFLARLRGAQGLGEKALGARREYAGRRVLRCVE